MKMAYQAYIYHIWSERNSRLYKQIQKSPTTVTEFIFQVIRHIIYGSPKFRRACEVNNMAEALGV